MANTPGKSTILQLSISSVYTAIAQLRRVTAPQMTMGTVETTDINSTWKTFIATVLDGGEVDAVIRYDAGQATHAQLWTSFQAGTAESWKVIFADTGAAELGFSAIITDFKPSEATIDGIVELNCKLKVTGTVTLTP